MRKLCLAVVLVLISATWGYGMWCVPYGQEEAFERADLIFEGILLEIEKLPDGKFQDPMCWTEESGSNELCGSKILRFQVQHTRKGKAGKILRVFSEDGCYCCGMTALTLGELYVVFAIFPDDPEMAAHDIDGIYLDVAP